MPDYARYGLPANPYKSRELDPCGRPTDEHKMLDVDGFSTSKAIIDDTLIRAAETNAPAFFLLAGNSGTGRTTVANWILARHCFHRGISPSRLIVPRRKVETRDHFYTLLNWFGFLHNIIKTKQDISLGGELNMSLNALPSTARVETMVPTFAGLAQGLHTALFTQKSSDNTPLPAAFAVCLEQVEAYGIIRAVFDIFEEIPTVAVFTTYDLENVGKEVVELFRQAGGPFRQVIRLHPLTATEVGEVVTRRWSETSSYPDQPPFDINSLGKALGQRPLGRVLVLMSRLIDIKLAEPGHDAAWPLNRNLQLTPQQIEQLLAVLEADYGR